MNAIKLLDGKGCHYSGTWKIFAPEETIFHPTTSFDTGQQGWKSTDQVHPVIRKEGISSPSNARLEGLSLIASEHGFCKRMPVQAAQGNSVA